MALPILDGNQTATTLSTILTGGAHIPAHTVVSLGSQAITDISNAVSSVQISGTVTATLTDQQTDSGTPIFVAAYVSSPGGSAIPVSQDAGAGMPISGTVTVGNSITIGASSVTLNSNVAKRSDGSWHPLSVESGSNYVNARVYSPSSELFTATVTVGNSVTIAGTVTANTDSTSLFTALENYSQNWNDAFPVALKDSAYTTENPFPIAGTVTANVNFAGTNGTTLPSNIAILGAEEDGNGNAKTLQADGNGFLKVSLQDSGVSIDGKIIASDGISDVNITATTDGSKNRLDVNASGTVTANAFGWDNPNGVYAPIPLSDGGGHVVVAVDQVGSSFGSVPISGTVTVGAVPNGSLTTRFGTPTTANTAFATSAVTNANRKYLLVQNVTTGGNVITVGIGFTPTTTQGIQLAVGAGITFESSYIPTGAVYVLSSVTASNFTILEA